MASKSMDCNSNRAVNAPGSCLTDQSVFFWKDALHFYRKREAQNKNKTWNVRFMLKTTTFVGSIYDTHAALKNYEMDMGYKDYFHAIYGDVILFNNGEEARSQHKILSNFFASMCSVDFSGRVSQMMRSHIDLINLKQDVDIYAFFKRFCTELLLVELLGLDSCKDKQLIEEIMHLSVLHWHGIISVPLKFASPMGSSGYKKALNARVKLVEIVSHLVEKSVAGSTLYSFSQSSFGSQSVMVDHLVLLITALVPKACASILTSAIISAPCWIVECLDEKGSFVSDDCLNFVLYEVARMWPPFVAIRRICKERGGMKVGDFCIPYGRPVMFHILAAHRDAHVFENPDEFNWKRWQKSDLTPDKLLWFGAGSRKCIGHLLMHTLLKTALKQFCSTVEWDVKKLCDPDACHYKWLPVARPAVKPMIKLFSRCSQ